MGRQSDPSPYTVDPCAISYHDTLWIFTGHDENSATTGVKDGVRLSEPARWTLCAASGRVLGKGVSDRAKVAGPSRGIYLLVVDGEARRVALW